MAVADEESIFAEPPFKGGGTDFLSLSKEERKAAKKRAIARSERWENALRIRKNWSPEQFAAEEQEIARQIEEWEFRNAA